MKNNIIFIGITGGSGSGKSTLANTLKKRFYTEMEIIHLDDYIKPLYERPVFDGFINTDHPDSIFFENLRRDVNNLASRKLLSIILIEGFLLLHDEEIRRILDISIYLDLREEVRWERRLYPKEETRRRKILIPMHNKYIEPTKKYANYIIDVNNLSKEEVLEKTEQIIRQVF